MPESIEGHTYAMKLVEVNTGVKVLEKMKGKSASVALEAFKNGIGAMRQLMSKERKIVCRCHSDCDKSYTEITEYCRENGWKRTETEGYDHDGNQSAEKGVRAMREAVRVQLLDATGGRAQYRELVIPAMEHAADVQNHLRSAGLNGKTAVERAGGKPIDIDEEIQCHACVRVSSYILSVW
jgi:hypothetical protein